MTNTANVSTPKHTGSAPVPLVGIEETLDLLIKISRSNQQGPRAGDQLSSDLLGSTAVTSRPRWGELPGEPEAELAQDDIWLRDDAEAWISEHGDALADMLRQTR